MLKQEVHLNVLKARDFIRLAFQRSPILTNNVQSTCLQENKTQRGHNFRFIGTRVDQNLALSSVHIQLYAERHLFSKLKALVKNQKFKRHKSKDVIPHMHATYGICGMPLASFFFILTESYLQMVIDEVHQTW